MAALPEVLRRALEGRYRIERELGRGGMATVFLAADLRHRRRVAIKVLDSEVAGAIGPERFLREIETVANLTHPHILPLYDSGEAAGLLYYVMPYVEDESLRQRLAREGALPLDEALRITREIADALAHAHTHGVVHRDIKPENVLVAAGHAVVADFGLARALGAAAPQRLTTAGVTVGTPTYMSPEQAAGAPQLDGRSDQYSLGCVLYELLAGVPPFTGPSVQSVMHQHLHVMPRPVTELRPSVPGPVRDAVAKSLAKLPADRYATLAEFAHALGAPSPMPGPVASAAPAPAALETAPTAEMAAARTPEPRRSRLGAPRWVAAVAVLAVLGWVGWWALGPKATPGPVKKDWILVAEFEGPPDDSSLAVAARELISAAIDQSRTVGSLPREKLLKALVAAGKPLNTRVDAELARELAFRSAVRTVLEGHVGRLGSGYSIVLRLVNADSANVILTETGTAKNEDALIPALGELAKRLRKGMGENRAALAATRSMALVMTPSFEAYKLFLRGRQRSMAGDNIQAKALFRQAISLDPDFAEAWAALRFPYGNLGHVDSVAMVCEQALRRSNRLSVGSRERLQFTLVLHRGDWDEAASILDRALIENPDDRWALVATFDLLWWLGRYEDALERVRRLELLRPLGPVEGDFLNEAETLSRLGRFDEARRVLASMTGVWKLPLAAQNELRAGNYAAAESLALAQRQDPRQALENPGGPELTLGRVRQARGRFAAAESSYAQLWELARRPENPFNDSPQLFREALVFSALCEGRTIPRPDVPWPETTAVALLTRGLHAAYRSDLVTARRCLERAKHRPRRELVREGPIPTLLEATIRGAEGRWDAAVQSLQPLAVERNLVGCPGGDDLSWVRWTIADAYGHMGRADSAAANLERIARDPRTSTFRPYASLRLVPLYAKLGLRQDAMRHWVLAMNAFEKADAVLRPRIDEADAALASLQ